ncbi:hypothetical protein GCM10025791_00560 [Halioxenophilus aromaticivorans]|uniref:tRNA-queuosine alpha-mannosyltransferase n=2 Tax=Halioxenophilus aromaticivorans TaxID=1306992 RepID=A0AAV3TW41_9ALTE
MTLPARHFSWRMRGNSLTWGLGNYPELEADYDLILATSMVDLTALRGFRPHLAKVPTVVYFHENQFAYPASLLQQGLVEIQLTSLYSALVADRVLFNSRYNMDTFLTGGRRLLKKMPDAVPVGLMDSIQNKSHVLPVPLDDSQGRTRCQSAAGSKVLEIVWNHRWEWDKGPDILLRLVSTLAQRHLLDNSLRFHVIGQQFRRVPKEFEQIELLLVEHQALGAWGYVESRESYLKLLSQSHMVLSTARHDFQGLALLEAVMAGCIPAVPRRLAYPEWFGERRCHGCDDKDPQIEVDALIQRILELKTANGATTDSARLARGALVDDQAALLEQLSGLGWSHLGPQYHHRLII